MAASRSAAHLAVEYQARHSGLRTADQARARRSSHSREEGLMILVVGATGMLGGEICDQLTAAGHSIRALVRQTSDESRVER